MPQPVYSVDYNQCTRFLQVSLRGLWSIDTVNAFTRELMVVRHRVSEAGFRDDRGRILLDLSGLMTQPPAIGDALAALLPQLATRASRVAVIRSASMVQRQQLRRILPYQKVRMFDTGETARAWLSEDDA